MSDRVVGSGAVDVDAADAQGVGVERSQFAHADAVGDG